MRVGVVGGWEDENPGHLTLNCFISLFILLVSPNHVEKPHAGTLVKNPCCAPTWQTESTVWASPLRPPVSRTFRWVRSQPTSDWPRENSKDGQACAYSCMLSVVWLFVTPRTVAHQAPLSMGFFRQEHWNGLPFPPPGDLPHPGIEPVPSVFPALAGGFFTPEPPGKCRV